MKAVESSLKHKPLGHTPAVRYEVFGRGRVDGALEHIGSLSAPNAEMAQAQTRLLYTEKNWFELVLAPSTAFVKLIGDPRTPALGAA